MTDIYFSPFPENSSPPAPPPAAPPAPPRPSPSRPSAPLPRPRPALPAGPSSPATIRFPAPELPSVVRFAGTDPAPPIRFPIQAATPHPAAPRGPGVVVGQGDFERSMSWDEIDALLLILFALFFVAVCLLIAALV